MSATPHLNVVACDTSRPDWSARVARLGVTDFLCLVWFMPPAGMHLHSPLDRAPRAASPALPSPCRKVHVGETIHVPHARPSQYSSAVGARGAASDRPSFCGVRAGGRVGNPTPPTPHPCSAAGRHLVSAPPLGCHLCRDALDHCLIAAGQTRPDRMSCNVTLEAACYAILRSCVCVDAGTWGAPAPPGFRVSPFRAQRWHTHVPPLRASYSMSVAPLLWLSPTLSPRHTLWLARCSGGPRGPPVLCWYHGVSLVRRTRPALPGHARGV